MFALIEVFCCCQYKHHLTFDQAWMPDKIFVELCLIDSLYVHLVNLNKLLIKDIQAAIPFFIPPLPALVTFCFLLNLLYLTQNIFQN